MDHDTLPAPLLGPEVDLRDFPFMPLDVVRLRDSSLSVEASGDEFRAAVLLWCAAWHQSPAGSLPDNDAALAQYAGYGRVVKEWLKVKDGALRGWIKCSDGRLYHPVVCEKAEKAWAEKAGYAARKAADRERKRGKKPAEQPLELPKPSNGNNPDAPKESGDVSAGIPAENALKGEGEEREKKESPNGDGRAAARSYAFEGRVIKLTPKDYKTWKANFHGIPDIDAELRVLDEFYANEPKAKLGNWFVRCATALNNKHQEHLARRPPTKDVKSRPQLADVLKDGKY